jgi:hypothetical protein
MVDQPRTPDPRDTGAIDDAPRDDAKEPRDQQDKGGIVDMLLREGPDAPDAADIEDPERQL